MRRVAIVGPGAVASVIAWHLADADCELTVVARPGTATALARDGVTLIGAGADARPRRVAATSDAAQAGAQDLVLVGFKAHDWPAGAGMVHPLIGPHTVVLPMLNGVPWWYFQGLGGAHEGRVVRSVDPEGALAAAIPPESVLGCVVYVAAERESPSRVKWNGRKRLIIGEPRGGVSDRMSSTIGVLRSAGIDAAASADIRHDLWVKLLGNVSYNPLSVAALATMGRMGRHEPLKRIVRRMMEEAIGVARAVGVTGAFDVDQRLDMRPEMFGVKTSMLQDHEAGRALELGAIVEAVVELGRLAGAPTPMIEAIGALAAERQAIALGEERK